MNEKEDVIPFEDTIKMLHGMRADNLNLNVLYIKDKYNALGMAIEALRFAKWVAEEIFDDYWEWNEDAFAELACRKLAKLGIVRAKGDVWELVEPQESE